jgi:hypothetical protein
MCDGGLRPSYRTREWSFWRQRTQARPQRRFGQQNGQDLISQRLQVELRNCHFRDPFLNMSVNRAPDSRRSMLRQCRRLYPA